MSKALSTKELFEQGEHDYYLTRYPQALKPYLKAAQQNYPLAFMRLSRMYSTGRGVAISKEEAVKWTEKVKQNWQWFQTEAAGGNEEAQVGLGLCYENGIGVDQDQKQAIIWYKKAQAQGSTKASLGLAFCYQDDKEMEDGPKQAFDLFQKLAEQKHPYGQLAVGWCYQDGLGTLKDEKLSVFWYNKAIEQGQLYAMLYLGYLYAKGSEVIPKDEKQAAALFRKAADQEFAEAQVELGVCYENGKGVAKSQREANSWYKKSAEQGSARGQFLLGLSFAESKNEKEALLWITRAAEQGFASAQNYLGRVHDVPAEVPQGFDIFKHSNKSLATEWYIKAAEQGHARAQFRLFELYERTPSFGVFAKVFSVPEDAKQRFVWCQEAVKKPGKLNIGVIQFMLGDFYEYERGSGITTDRQQARYWYTQALKNGVTASNFRLESLSNSVVCSSKEEADAMVKEWLSQPSSSSAPASKQPLLAGNRAGTFGSTGQSKSGSSAEQSKDSSSFCCIVS